MWLFCVPDGGVPFVLPKIESNSAVIWQQMIWQQLIWRQMCEKVPDRSVPTVYLPCHQPRYRPQWHSSSETSRSWSSPVTCDFLQTLMESSIQLERIWEIWRNKPEKTLPRYCQKWHSSSETVQMLMESSWILLSSSICLPSAQSSLLPAAPFVTFTITPCHISLSGSFIWPAPRRWSKSFIRSICHFKPFHFPLSTVRPRVEINWISASKTE